MAMSRKHYREVAEVIKNNLDDLRLLENNGTPPAVTRYARDVVQSVANDLAVVFKADNSNFRRDQFMEACGL